MKFWLHLGTYQPNDGNQLPRRVKYQSPPPRALQALRRERNLPGVSGTPNPPERRIPVHSSASKTWSSASTRGARAWVCQIQVLGSRWSITLLQSQEPSGVALICTPSTDCCPSACSAMLPIFGRDSRSASATTVVRPLQTGALARTIRPPVEPTAPP